MHDVLEHTPNRGRPNIYSFYSWVALPIALPCSVHVLSVLCVQTAPSAGPHENERRLSWEFYTEDVFSFLSLKTMGRREWATHFCFCFFLPWNATTQSKSRVCHRAVLNLHPSWNICTELVTDKTRSMQTTRNKTAWLGRITNHCGKSVGNCRAIFLADSSGNRKNKHVYPVKENREISCNFKFS